MKRLTKVMSLIITTSIIVTCIPIKNVFASTATPLSTATPGYNQTEIAATCTPGYNKTEITATPTPKQNVPEGKEFIFDPESGTISGYTGTSKDVTIPQTIDGVQVKSIDEKAFASDCKITITEIEAKKVTETAPKVAPEASSAVDNKYSYGEQEAKTQKVAKETINSDTDLAKVASTSSTGEDKALIPMIVLMALSILGLRKQKKLN